MLGSDPRPLGETGIGELFTIVWLIGRQSAWDVGRAGSDNPSRSMLIGREFSAVEDLLVVAIEKATAAYESGGVRKMLRTPGHSLAQNAGDRRVF